MFINVCMCVNVHVCMFGVCDVCKLFNMYVACNVRDVCVHAHICACVYA